MKTLNTIWNFFCMLLCVIMITTTALRYLICGVDLNNYESLAILILYMQFFVKNRKQIDRQL